MAHKPRIRLLESQASQSMAHTPERRVQQVLDDKIPPTKYVATRKSFYERYPNYKSRHWVDEVRRI